MNVVVNQLIFTAGASLQVNVTYGAAGDASLVNVATITGENLLVYHDTGYVQTVPVDDKPATNQSPATANYLLTVLDLLPVLPGTYRVKLRANQVSDVLGAFAAETELGSFVIAETFAALPTYLALAAANAMAAGMLSRMVSSYAAASSADRVAALAQASAQIDRAMRYQGRQYDPSGTITGTVQVLEFPRVLGSGGFPPYLSYPDGGQCPPYASQFWDWDKVNNVAVVPDRVKQACVLQANSLLAGDRDERLAARHDGVSQQSGDGLSEAYSGEAPLLCAEAHRLMSYYRLRSGEMV